MHRLVRKIQGEMSRDELMAALELKVRDNFQKSYEEIVPAQIPAQRGVSIVVECETQEEIDYY